MMHRGSNERDTVISDVIVRFTPDMRGLDIQGAREIHWGKSARDDDAFHWDHEKLVKLSLEELRTHYLNVYETKKFRLHILPGEYPAELSLQLIKSNRDLKEVWLDPVVTLHVAGGPCLLTQAFSWPALIQFEWTVAVGERAKSTEKEVTIIKGHRGDISPSDSEETPQAQHPSI